MLSCKGILFIAVGSESVFELPNRQVAPKVIIAFVISMPPPRTATMHLHSTILVAITLQLALLLPTLIRLIFRYHMKEPYHTSILSGYAWVQELLNGHPERIRTELGVHKEVFHALINELRSMGHADTKYVTLEEQLAIFLYTSVTGLTIRHVGERFQRANWTVSKCLQL
jgi:hypothetical protein